MIFLFLRSIPQSRYKNLQQRIQSQQEEIFKLETNIQDYRAKLDVLREDNENLLKRVDKTKDKKFQKRKFCFNLE